MVGATKRSLGRIYPARQNAGNEQQCPTSCSRAVQADCESITGSKTLPGDQYECFVMEEALHCDQNRQNTYSSQENRNNFTSYRPHPLQGRYLRQYSTDSGIGQTITNMIIEGNSPRSPRSPIPFMFRHLGSTSRAHSVSVGRLSSELGRSESSESPPSGILRTRSAPICTNRVDSRARTIVRENRLSAESDTRSSFVDYLQTQLKDTREHLLQSELIAETAQLDVQNLHLELQALKRRVVRLEKMSRY